MTLTRQTIFTFAAALLMVVAVSGLGIAQGSGDADGAGTNLRATLESVITGQIGLFIGLAIVVLGLWTWIIKQETGAGITMILGGVLITLAPGMFNGVRQFMGGVVGAFGGNTQQIVAGSLPE
jgi:hypothetical protein